MNSLRGAYKAQLREGFSSIANRRRSKGVDRKNRRDDEVSKRRNLSNENDMSPVVERHETQSISQRTKRGSKKADTVLERLKVWRDEKKRQQVQEKQKANSKPVFKFRALARDSEAELFKGGVLKSKNDKPKDVEIKVPPPKKQTDKVKAPGRPVTRGSQMQRNAKSTADLTSKHSTGSVAKVPSSKKQPIRTKEQDVSVTLSSKKPPTKNKETNVAVTNKSKLQRATTTGDLATKLTAAAAAKRNAKASPKKFLRATRASTLQKKESTGNKRGAKITKGSSKGDENLLSKEKDSDKTEFSPENASTSLNPSGSLIETSPTEEFNSVIPREVPKILTDFNFSDMVSSSTDNAGSSNAESDFSFAGLKLKSKRKSTRKSTRLAAEGDDISNKHNIEESSDDNLITFTPRLAKRKSQYESMRQNSPSACSEMKTVETDQVEITDLKVSNTPKSAKRKISHKPALLDSLLIRSVEGGIEQDGINFSMSATPKSGRRKSVRRSIRLAPEMAEVVADTDFKLRATPKSAKRKSMRKSTRLATQSEEFMDDIAASSPVVKMFSTVTPKSGKSSRKSRILGSTASKQFDELHITDRNSLPGSSAGKLIENESLKLDQSTNDSNIPRTPLTSGSKRKSVRKSLSLEAALALVQSDSEIILDSGTGLSQEEEMVLDADEQFVSDVDTQVPLVDMTSTPKASTSVQQKRRSLLTSLKVSGLDDISSEELAVSSQESPQQSSQSARSRKSVLRRRSRKSLATPARSASGDNAEINISNVSTPNSVRNMENIPRRRSTVISVSDEGTAVGRELEPALAYKVEQVRRSARASRILNELVIEKVDGEKSFFEVSIDESMKGNGSRNNSINIPFSKCNTPSGDNKTPQSSNTSPFTPRKSNEVTVSSNSASSSLLTTPASAVRTRHSIAPSSGFKEPGLPLSALRSAGSQRRRTCYTPKSKTPEQMIRILKKSPMVEMGRRKSRHMSSPAPKGQFFRDLINSETERLTNLSNRWNTVAAMEIGLSEEVLGQIRSTVGKALLLMKQRFKQFSGLIDNYVYDLGEKKTTPTDLQGFWDMIYFQVEDVNNQFKDLEELQQLGWKGKANTPKADRLELKKKIVKAKPKTKGGVKSNFAAFRAELQKKKAAQSSSSLTTDQMFIV